MILDGILVAIKIVFTRRKKMHFVVFAKTSPKTSCKTSCCSLRNIVKIEWDNRVKMRKKEENELSKIQRNVFEFGAQMKTSVET